MVATLAFVVYC